MFDFIISSKSASAGGTNGTAGVFYFERNLYILLIFIKERLNFLINLNKVYFFLNGKSILGSSATVHLLSAAAVIQFLLLLTFLHQ